MIASYARFISSRDVDHDDEDDEDDDEEDDDELPPCLRFFPFAKILSNNATCNCVDSKSSGSLSLDDGAGAGDDDGAAACEPDDDDDDAGSVPRPRVEFAVRRDIFSEKVTRINYGSVQNPKAYHIRVQNNEQ